MNNFFIGLLSDISLRTKLLLGFGLVLLLTLGIAITGWIGLDKLKGSADRLTAIQNLKEGIRDVRISRLSYTLTLGEEKAVAAIKELDNVDKRAALIRSVVDSESEQELAMRIIEAAKNYRQHLELFFKDIETREASRSFFGKYADSAVTELADIRAYVKSSSLDKDTAQIQLDQITTQDKLVQDARFQLRGYSFSGRPELHEIALNSIDVARTNVTVLSAALPAAIAANLQRLMLALDNYRAEVAVFPMRYRERIRISKF